MFDFHQPPEKIASELAALQIMKATSGQPKPPRPDLPDTPDWRQFMFWSRVVIFLVVMVPLILLVVWVMSF